MSRIKTISIPEPCHQSWQQMTEVNNGRQCDHCCKTVVDFTLMSDAEIIRYFLQNRNVCGRIEQYQLAHINNTLQAKKPAANSWWRRAVIILGLLGPISLKVSGQSKQTIINTESAKHKPHKAKVNPKENLLAARTNDVLEVRSSAHIPTPGLTNADKVEPHQIGMQSSCSVVMGGAIVVVSTYDVYRPMVIWRRIKGKLGIHSELVIENVNTPLTDF
jgi:hypothetical protein